MTSGSSTTNGGRRTGTNGGCRAGYRHRRRIDGNASAATGAGTSTNRSRYIISTRGSSSSAGDGRIFYRRSKTIGTGPAIGSTGNFTGI